MKILLAIDSSKFSEAAVRMLVQQMRTQGAQVRVLHVVESLLLVPQFRQADLKAISDAEKALMEEGKKLVARTQEQIRKAGFEVQGRVEEGDPRAVISDRAERWTADLIILGSHGRKGLDRMLMGSVAEFVARHAHCSVLIVRRPKSPKLSQGKRSEQHKEGR
jgi:nucleotide-binding universal stress UspA family protein